MSAIALLFHSKSHLIRTQSHLFSNPKVFFRHTLVSYNANDASGNPACHPGGLSIVFYKPTKTNEMFKNIVNKAKEKLDEQNANLKRIKEKANEKLAEMNEGLKEAKEKAAEKISDVNADLKDLKAKATEKLEETGDESVRLKGQTKGRPGAGSERGRIARPERPGDG
ncbi:MAG: hypothetical protein KDC65_07085 [Saprospiraceae bacterium]|nr:hypothetical protein [Saprospiraceae bacterium]